MPDDFKFEVGATYKNMKGTYEVISIHQDAMVIRWNNGSEIATSIELQARIIERMAHEKALQQQLHDSEKQKQNQKNRPRAKSGFAGFTAEHFSSVNQDMTWRNRSNLGGRVSKHLRSSRIDFNSWAVPRQPEVQWMDIVRHGGGHPDCGTVFFARIDTEALHFGLIINRPGNARDGATQSGNRFEAWLTTGEHENWMKAIAADSGLVIYDASGKGFTGEITADGDNWSLNENKAEGTLDSLAAFISSISDRGRIDLRIEKRMQNEAAIAAGNDITKEISALFALLLPLYRMTPVAKDRT